MRSESYSEEKRSFWHHIKGLTSGQPLSKSHPHCRKPVGKNLGQEIRDVCCIPVSIPKLVIWYWANSWGPVSLYFKISIIAVATLLVRIGQVMLQWQASPKSGGFQQQSFMLVTRHSKALCSFRIILQASKATEASHSITYSWHLKISLPSSLQQGRARGWTPAIQCFSSCHMSLLSTSPWPKLPNFTEL